MREATIVTPDEITAYVVHTYTHIVPKHTWGEQSFFYNPDSTLPRGTYFLTLKEQDGRHDAASRLHRPGVFRLNVGIAKGTYHHLFGALPPRPAAGGVVATGHSFDQLDVILPHPIYAWGAWICVLNPSVPTWEHFKPYIDEGYRLAAGRWHKRHAQPA
jgi:hypothetical protein